MKRRDFFSRVAGILAAPLLPLRAPHKGTEPVEPTARDTVDVTIVDRSGNVIRRLKRGFTDFGGGRYDYWREEET